MSMKHIALALTTFGFTAADITMRIHGSPDYGLGMLAVASFVAIFFV